MTSPDERHVLNLSCREVAHVAALLANTEVLQKIISGQLLACTDPAVRTKFTS